jgi:hypothetical protein
MPEGDTDFAKLLRDAPMVSDTVTVAGMIARTPDPTRFMLTLPDGRSETLQVEAVKSAKIVASTIGQSVVQLELDAKRIPESLRRAERNPLVAGGVGVGGDPGPMPFVVAMPHQAPQAMIEAQTNYLGAYWTLIGGGFYTSDHRIFHKVQSDPQRP